MKGEFGRIRIELFVSDENESRPYLASEVFALTDIYGKRIPPAELAAPMLRAWRKAVAQAEETIMLYGFEGLATPTSGGEEYE